MPFSLPHIALPTLRNLDPEDEPIGTSYLGTPVYSGLKFLNTFDVIQAGTVKKPADNTPPLFLETVLIDVEQTKNIVKTTIPGQIRTKGIAGTIKEYISDDDYKVNVKGAIVSRYPLKYPQEDISILLQYLKANIPLPVYSPFLESFGIFDIVITRYQIAEKLGSRNEVPFQIEAISDAPAIFQLNPRKP